MSRPKTFYPLETIREVFREHNIEASKVIETIARAQMRKEIIQVMDRVWSLKEKIQNQTLPNGYKARILDSEWIPFIDEVRGDQQSTLDIQRRMIGSMLRGLHRMSAPNLEKRVLKINRPFVDAVLPNWNGARQFDPNILGWGKYVKWDLRKGCVEKKDVSARFVGNEARTSLNDGEVNKINE